MLSFQAATPAGNNKNSFTGFLAFDSFSKNFFNSDFREQISYSNYAEVNHVKQLSTDIGTYESAHKITVAYFIAFKATYSTTLTIAMLV